MELPSVSRKLGVFLVLLLLVLLVTANLLLTVWIILALRLNSQGEASQAVKPIALIKTNNSKIYWSSLLSLRTETKQKYVYRLGLDKKYLCRPGQRGDSNQRHSYLRHRPRDGQPRGLHHHGLRPGRQPRARRGQGGQWGTSFYRCKTTMLR